MKMVELKQITDFTDSQLTTLQCNPDSYSANT